MAMIKCKRIIDGKTYNTETATLIVSWEQFSGQYEYGQILYQTRFGSYFLFLYEDPLINMNSEHYEKIQPLSPTDAQTWLEKFAPQKPELIERLFGEMPEGGSSEVKFTLRIPESLRDRLADHASANKQSLNAWIIRCLESCAVTRESQ
jgi:hypothetical protein